MAGILEFEKQCYQYLNSLNNCFTANANTIAVNKYALGEELNFSKVITDRIVKFLLNTGALKGVEGESIKITTKGIEQLISFERENSKTARSNSYNINVGSMSGSNIIQASRGVQITTVLNQTQTQDIIQIISSIKDIMKGSELSEEQKAELDTEVESLQIQLKAPRPRIDRIKDYLTSVKNIIEGSSIGAVVVSKIAAFLSTLG
ncbi:MAG: hypothetical protein ACREBU_20510 [Nitrososphaera sp.]